MQKSPAVRDRLADYGAGAHDPNERENRLARQVEERRREIRDGSVEAIPGAEVLERLASWHPGD